MWSMVLFLLFALTGCGECEHEYDNGIISKETTCTEEGEKTFTCSLCGEIKTESVAKKEHTYKEKITKESTYTEKGEKTFSCMDCNDSYTEEISVLDAEPYNQNIYKQMTKFCDEGDYINALIVGRDALPSSGETQIKINELSKEIVTSQKEYINNQIQSAIENSDYEALDTLYYNKRWGAYVKFSSEQEWIYQTMHDLQGEYTYSESTDSNTQVRINGFNLEMGDKEYILHTKFISPYEWMPEYRDLRLVFEGGSIEEIRTGLIAIQFDDGTSIRCESDAGKQWKEKQEQKEEEKRQAEEKEKQEYLANEPKIGMTADEVKASNWGSPEKINKTTYEWGVTEQWCYPNYKYIYFEDGIVTAIQE
ncbi:MAG: hypothetical protein J1F42_13465 [Lachnospiraceae bacterium]|nr:hypothetical protein [Lachnospiraceae bacterium]